MFDGPDYELAWPKELFVDEAQSLILIGHESTVSRVELLLEEAFVSSVPKEEYLALPKHASRASFDDPWASSPTAATKPETPHVPQLDQSTYLDRLIENAHGLKEATSPQPYWNERKGSSSPAPSAVNAEAARRRVVSLLGELENAGYLERAFPRICVDDPYGEEVDRSAKLEEFTGIPELWPMKPTAWDDDTFFTVIEVFHDLVARPRDRSWHNWNQCGWHYSAFSVKPARALYTTKVNRVLESANIPLRLATSGENAGRLVHLIEDDRRVLLARALGSPNQRSRDHIEHATALFRRRTATAQDKRSAVITLAHVLEDRRKLLKKELLSRDEGALFQIANEFAIRHESERQKGDYDAAFLDWIFWWYLATIELTDRLVARTQQTDSST
ncbi:hypothetical protein ABGB16_01130 [Micromonospora sp. B11E3]|uniref:hypothetical protein n=1 Tax=Micromonospora sp. B11E3 TaxID=3153562 RepID=UPI00325E7903